MGACDCNLGINHHCAQPNQGLTKDRFVLYGQGYGSIPVCNLTFHSSNAYTLLLPSKIILENPVAHSDFLVSNATQLNIPSSYVSDVSFDNIKKIQSAQQPLLVFLSEYDEKFESSKNGELLYEYHAGQSKEIHIVVGANHKNLISTFSVVEFHNILNSFITNN